MSLRDHRNQHIEWANAQTIPSVDYYCAYCNCQVASQIGIFCRNKVSGRTAVCVAICHSCQYPTIVGHDGSQIPDQLEGPSVTDISEAGVAALYEEARRSARDGNNISCVMACRVVLMYAAVHKGAPTDKSFAQYVTFLADNHFVPPDCKEMLDHIKDLGNRANHDIRVFTRDEALEALEFTAAILRFMFEFPARVAARRKK